MEEKLLLRANELVTNPTVKEEPEWLKDGFPTPDGVVEQEFMLLTDSVPSIKTEAEPFRTDAAVLAVQPLAQTDEFIKTELILEDQTLEPKSNSVTTTTAQQIQKPRLNLSEDDTARVNIAGEDWEICENCYKLYPKGGSEAHMREGNCKKAFQCNSCPNSYREKRHLTRHIAAHHQYQCHFCPRSFTEKRHLTRHTTAHHQFQCQLCPLSFQASNSLTQHSKVHDEYPREIFFCHHCGLQFLYKHSLSKHLVTHIEDRKMEYKCGSCEKAFYTQDGLSEHMAIHAPESHDCDVCGAHFLENEELKRHNLQSAECNGPLKCETCGKSFRSELDRNGHACTQRSDCDSCHKSYANKYTLAVHSKEHADHCALWKCSICQRKFTKKNRCRAHVKRVHNVTDSSKANKLTQTVLTAK